MAAPIDAQFDLTRGTRVFVSPMLGQIIVKDKDAAQSESPGSGLEEPSSANNRTVFAPIEYLPFDVLSHIFEICGHEDWMDSVRISRVSRSLRKAIFDTPNAWSFIESKNGPRLSLICYHLPRITQRPVHIRMDISSMPGDILVGIMNTLHCLSFECIPLNLDMLGLV